MAGRCLPQRHAWPAFDAALRALHHPETPAALGPEAPARRRLAYDELLANQLALALVRANMKRAAGRTLPRHGCNRARRSSRPCPTASPMRSADAVDDILRDMAAPERMLRLLQGDVGSGKTVVALLALATAVESGAQGALMVPTEILARQHLATLSKLCGRGRHPHRPADRAREGHSRAMMILARVGVGRDRHSHRHPCAVPGTTSSSRIWASWSSTSSTASACISGLRCRPRPEALADLLVMTATPIPRTLALTVYGDMDVSKLTEKPAGRQPIDTRVMPLARMDEVVEGLARDHGAGQSRLLGLPPGRGKRDGRPRRRRRSLQCPRRTLSRARWDWFMAG